MSVFDKYVLDASMGFPFCFCPVEGDLCEDFTIVTGMNFIGSLPPNEKLLAIIHEDGQDAVEEFCERYKRELETLYDALRAAQDARGKP